LVLLAAMLLGQSFGATPAHSTLWLSMGYAFVAVVAWFLPVLRRQVTRGSLARLSSPQWWGSIGLDLLVFGLVNALDSGAAMGYSALFIMPVLMAGVLTPRLLALATAAMAALLLLTLAGWGLGHSGDMGLRLSQAGLVGSGLFALGLLASEMASRLAREEQTARGSMAFARQQAELNRLVIDEMQEGVLVVDRRGRVRAANPAARALLGAHQPVRPAPFQLRSVAAWSALVRAVEDAFVNLGGAEAGQDVLLPFEGGPQRSLRLRMRFTRRRDAQRDEDLCVLLIEDNRKRLARSRQEKLAAMGRVSAGIAHEIRNPLAAIDQANALLSEDVQDPRAQQLIRMVASNVQRLKRIVDDVMEVAPGIQPEPVALDATLLVREACEDWCRTNQLPDGADSPLQTELPTEPLMVMFEPEHLRRVLINLLDNGLRHAPAGPGVLRLRLEPHGEGWVQLSVFSVGQPLPPDVERHLFEPFFSTRSRGTGLGLYICRELCERYRARIEYRSRAELHPPGNEFRVLLSRAEALRSALFSSA